MPEAVITPFSVGLQGPHEQVDQEDWKSIAQELQRICRKRPVTYDGWQSGQEGDPAVDAEQLLMQIPWQKVFDFCERLHSDLVKAVGDYDDNDHWYATIPRKEVQSQVAVDICRLFLEERLAFQFKDGLVQRHGRSHTNEQLARADVVLGDPRLASARMHWSKACLRNAKNPDPENAVKEAVCSVEAAGRALFPGQDAKTLGDLVGKITGTKTGEIPTTVAKTFHGLYGFRSGGDGVGHGGTTGGRVTPELAEYVLAVAASQIILLVDLAAALDPGVPF